MRLAVLTLVALLLAAAPASALEIHAHRGGPLGDGIPITPEDAQPAFDYGHSIGADVIELDSTLTRDGVAVVMHDATLDRTTDCTGQVRQRMMAEIAPCRVDIIGTDASIVSVPGSQVPVPRLADVLAWAKANGVRLNLEIKNIPTDPDFDPTTTVARGLVATVEASGIPREQVLLQSFWPPNLDEAEASGYRTALLTLSQMNDGAIAYAESRGYEVVSPQWPPRDPKAFVEEAHAAGKQVIPYTLDRPEAIAAAAAAGVDGLITNDLIVAQRTLYGADCPSARLKVANATRSLAKRRALRRRARTRSGRRRYAAKERSAVKRLRKGRALRLRACGPRL